MPYKCEKIAMPVGKDKRIKLFPCQKIAIKTMYATGLYSINGLAKLWKVNKRLIQFILFPERQQKNLQDRAINGGSKQYYDTKKNTIAKKEHRHYKQSLYLSGELLTEGNSKNHQ